MKEYRLKNWQDYVEHNYLDLIKDIHLNDAYNYDFRVYFTDNTWKDTDLIEEGLLFNKHKIKELIRKVINEYLYEQRFEKEFNQFYEKF